MAADFVVTRYDDPVPDDCLAADCSLREAVRAANADGTRDRIVLSAGVYTLALAGTNENSADDGDLDVFEDLDVVGVGAGLTVVDGASLDETVFATPATVGLEVAWSDLSVRNAQKTAIGVAVGTFLLERCEIRDNGTSGIFPGVIASQFATLTIVDSTIAGSTSAGLVILQSTAHVRNSTIAGNGQQEISVANSATFDCLHCTIVDPADGDPEVQILSSSAEFENSVVSGDCLLSSATLTSSGGNVESPGDTCAFDDASDQVSMASAKLNPLANYGGSTRTMQQTATSPVIGAATVAGCLALDELAAGNQRDQRGAVRPPDGVDCDSGAVQLTATDPPTPLFVDGFEQGDEEAWSDVVE